MIIDSHTPQSESNNSNNKSPYNTYNNVDDTSLLLYNNRTYSIYLPNIIIGLSTFYIMIICVKLFLKQRRRYINRLYRKEKQRLREKWENTLNQDNNTVYGDSDGDLADTGGDDKSLFIEFPKTAYTQKRSSYARSAPLLMSENSLQDDYSVTMAHSYQNNASFELAHPNPSDSTLININTNGDKSGASEKDKIIKTTGLFRHNYYWRMRNSKRLDLLWQWSVSMGYCQYEYGRRLDEKITELQDKQSIYYNKGESSLT
jgi:hypothetical protein